MKKIFYIKYILLLMVVLFVFLPSCKENEESSAGTPSLASVTTIKDQKTNITAGNMGDWIAIHGKNLESVTAISFNDVEVDMEEIYYQNEIIHLQVPIKIPTDINNKITVTTMGGEVSYNFTVNIPNLELTGMFNEYTLPGDTILISGRFIELYETDSLNTAVFFGDIQSPVIEATDIYITARVPLNVQPNVKVKAVNNKFGATAICQGYYQDKNNVITTFDDDFPYKGPINKGPDGQEWSSIVQLLYNNSTRPLSSGKCLWLNVGLENAPNGLGWWYLMENGYGYSQDMIDNPGNYVLKFELRMSNPTRSTTFHFYNYWNNPDVVITGEYLNVQNVNQWQTVTIPFEVIYPKAIHSNPPVSLNVRVQNFAPVEPLNMYFDNFRIYKKGD